MKIWGVVLLLSFGVFGQADVIPNVFCAPGDTTLHTCNSNAQPRDHEIALSHFQKVVFCQNARNGTYARVLDLDEKPATLGMRLTGLPKTLPLRYTFWAPQVEYTMLVKSAGTEANSTFSVAFTKDYSVSSSFDCN